MNSFVRSYPAVIDDVDTEKREVVAKVSVGDIDRHRTVIESRGINLDAYRQNPVVLFEHGKDPTRGALPIGRCLWIRPDAVGNGRILAKTRFATDNFSQMLLEFYRDGTMRGWSIMILPQEASPPTREEIRSRPELANCELVYRQSDLGEYSVVSVPSCASALSLPELRSLSRLAVGGFWSPSDEVKPLVAPIIERMTESGGMAEGGALVDDDDEADEPDDDQDDKPKKKKRKKKAEARDDDSDDAVDMAADEGEARSVDEAAEAVERTTPEVEADPVVDQEPAEVVERSAPDDEATTDEPVVIDESSEDASPIEAVKRNAERMAEFIAVSKGQLATLKEFAAPEPEPEAAPIVEPPVVDLPPLVGTPFHELTRDAAASIKEWQTSTVQRIQDLDGWLRGKA